MKKIFLFGMMCLTALAICMGSELKSTYCIWNNDGDGYIDLGLPSGTKWGNSNATGFYTYDEAFEQFWDRLPSKAQWEELKVKCQWSWIGAGYKIMGPNGNSIFLPTAGQRLCYGGIYLLSPCGYYWTRTPDDPNNAWYLRFDSNNVLIDNYYRCYGYSVRLVQSR